MRKFFKQGAHGSKGASYGILGGRPNKSSKSHENHEINDVSFCSSNDENKSGNNPPGGLSENPPGGFHQNPPIPNHSILNQSTTTPSLSSAITQNYSQEEVAILSLIQERGGYLEFKGEDRRPQWLLETKDMSNEQIIAVFEFAHKQNQIIRFPGRGDSYFGGFKAKLLHNYEKERESRKKQKEREAKERAIKAVDEKEAQEIKEIHRKIEKRKEDEMRTRSFINPVK